MSSHYKTRRGHSIVRSFYHLYYSLYFYRRVLGAIHWCTILVLQISTLAPGQRKAWFNRQWNCQFG